MRIILCILLCGVSSLALSQTDITGRYIYSTDGTTTGAFFTYPNNHHLYIGAGQHHGVKKQILLYNLGCADGCNVPLIQLLSDQIYTPGKVGVGTLTPQNKVHIVGGGNVLRLEATGNDVGITFQNPVSPNDANIRYDSGTAGFEFRTNGTNQAATKFFIGDDGKVGVGTYTPDALFTVKGEIHAEAINVDLNVPGPDYVFEKDYELRSLEETEAYIKNHKHLPEVPSAKEMEEQGIDLAEMNMLLLKKVEELTLHQIQLLKRIESLENQLK